MGIGTERLKRFVRRARAGERLTIGFLGGSITQGFSASAPVNCYAGRIMTLLADTFPGAELSCVNAGVGATGSYYGAIRLREDLLDHRPDLVFVDFSVNDPGEPRIMEGVRYPDPQKTYEGVLRGILDSVRMPAVIVLNNAFYETGDSTEEIHNAAADHYDIPHVSVRDLILPRIRGGEFTVADLSPDGLHPNDTGHRLIAEELMKPVLECLERLQGEDAGSSGGPGSADGDAADPELPAPFITDAYEKLRRYDVRSCAPELYGFEADETPQASFADFFKNGWIGRKKGDRLEVTIWGREIAVVYRRTIRRPAPVAELILDEDETHPIRLDGNFDEEWGDCLYLQPVLTAGETGPHRLRITITEASEEDRECFYLVCFGGQEV